MNVGHPSNLARLVAVYGGQMDETGKIHRQPDLAAMRRDLFSSSVSDDRTRAALKDFWDKYQLLLEPHGAVAWQGFLDWLAVEPLGDAPAVIVETANPAKFPEEIEKMMTWSPDVPPTMEAAIEIAGGFRPHGRGLREVQGVFDPTSRGLIVGAFLASSAFQNSNMALIVQKYGGTSVGNPDRIKNVAARVAKYRSRKATRSSSSSPP